MNELLIILLMVGYGMVQYSIAMFALKAYRKYREKRREAIIKRETRKMIAQIKLINAIAEKVAQSRLTGSARTGYIANLLQDEQLDVELN